MYIDEATYRRLNLGKEREREGNWVKNEDKKRKDVP